MPLAAGLLLVAASGGVYAQDAGASLPPGVQEVLKLAHAGISEDIILAQVKSSGASYSLSADQIIYLSGQGVSQTVIKALLPGAATPAPTAPTVPAAPVAPTVPAAPPTPAPVPAFVGSTPPVTGVPVPTPTILTTPTENLATFQGQLAPYGSWVSVPAYGLCWQPTVALGDPFWRPYLNQGHWIYTDAGWSWQSDYPWGDIVFHYGRWTHFDGRWIWVPGFDYAPAWVCWRQTEQYCGWAPLPPEAVFTPGIGLNYHGLLAADVDFGLDVDAFNFVPYGHFWDYNLFPFVAGPELRLGIFRGSVVLNGYRMDHGRFIIDGLGRDRIGLYTHHDVRIEVGRRDIIFGHDAGHDYGHDSRHDLRPDNRPDNRDPRHGW